MKFQWCMKPALSKHNSLKFNIQDIFITFAAVHKLRSLVNGKEKDPIYFARNYSLFA